MKNLKYTIILFLLVFTNNSCSDYLEEPLFGNQITQETVFSNRLYAEAFLWQTYRMILPFGFPYTDRQYKYEESRAMEESMILALESHYNSNSNVSNNVNEGGFLPSQHRFQNDMFLVNYEVVRHAYNFIENIDKVTEIPVDERNQMKAECKTMIALRYIEMLKQYGGVPIVRQLLSGSTVGLENITRGTIEETVEFIVELCEESLEFLPNVYPSQWTGRVTKGVALAVKAETLLFAASPLFNASEPFMPYAHPELVCYTNYDVNRWDRAAKANKDMIDWANANGHHMIDTDNPFDDYGRAVSEHDNPEVILAYKGRFDSQNINNSGFEKYYLPQPSGTWWGFYVLYNALPHFYKRDGTDQTWMQPGDPAEPYSEYVEKMDEMGVRFKQTFWAYGTHAYNNLNSDRFRWDYNKQSGDVGDDKTGAGFMVKFLYNYQNEEMKEWMIYRVTEFYLNYAESLNEFNFGANKEEVLTYLNLTRERAGLPAITSDDPRCSSQDNLRQLIRRERYVELFGEEHRSFDVRRWKIAEEPNNIGGPAYFFNFTQNEAKDDYIDYKIYRYEDRFWATKMYLTPFPEAEAGGESKHFQNEVAKGYIVQNPGY